jgi:hypothetical protein
MHDREDENALSPRALLRTMAIAALLAAAVSACNKSRDIPVTPQPPKPHAEAAGGAKLMHAIYQSDGRQRAFFAEGERPGNADESPRRLVIRS